MDFVPKRAEKPFLLVVYQISIERTKNILKGKAAYSYPLPESGSAALWIERLLDYFAVPAVCLATKSQVSVNESFWK